MKKLTLFLVAMFAMVNIANAQRAWAYGLGLESGADSYTFTFKATTAATATLVLYQDGTEVGTVDLGAAVAGDNSFTLTKEQINQVGVFNWGVRLDGEAIANAVEVTSAEDKYYYYLAQDVATNTNPESKHFGKIYVLETYPGAGDGLSAHSKTQKKGIYVYDPALNLENYGEGYLPENVTADFASGKQYRDLHRIAVNPITDEVAFVQSNVAKLWVANPENLNAAATNVIAGTGVKASSLCYDKEGTLYMMYPYATVAAIYKMVDGVPVKFVEHDNWGWTDDRNSIVSDGRGGLWVVQNIADLTTNAKSEDMLTHINKDGVVDLSVNKNASAELIAMMPAKSNRGHVAYYEKDDVLAIGGDGGVTLYNVTYTEDGPKLAKWMVVAIVGNNVDGLAFDYAGDLCIMTGSKERFYKFALPTADNICTTPAPKAQVIVLDEAIKQYTLTVVVNGEGEVEGTAAGLYLEGTLYELTATPDENNKFINWTLSDATTSTENPLTGVLNSDLIVTANFEELPQYSVTAHIAPDSTMGTVEGAGMYYEGQEVTLTAKANAGYAFVKWDDETTEPTITFEATADVIRTAYFKKVATRAWAYGLEMTEGADDYTFQFTTTADGEVKILFKDMDGNELIQYPIGALEAGEHTQAVPKTYFADIHKDAYWSVQIDGAEIAELAELTADNDAYRFYCPQGVVVDNNTESETFGQIYVAQSMNGGDDGMNARTKAQKRGIFLFDQNLKSLNPTDNVGVLPSNIEWAATGRQSIHRIAMNPVTHQLAMAYNVAPGAVWSVATNNVAGEATNLIAGTAITLPNSICFDEEGALYVMDNANATTGGTIYKVVNGVAEVFGAQNTTWANIENALASDGRGGLWFLQYRSRLDGYNLLTHLNADGEIDFAVNVTTPNGFVSQSSYRGAMAYNPREDMLAIGIGPDGQIGVSLYKVTYDETTGVPTVEFFAKTSAIGANVDALGFDYAGDLYVVSAAEERFYKFVVPTEDNICIVPAPAAKKLVLGTQCEVTVTVNDPAMGSVEGAGVYEKGEEVTLTANPVAHHRFAKWTGDKTSTDNPLKFTIEDNVTLIANFEPIPQYTITTSVNDEKMGSVTEGGTYYEGTEVTLTATAKGGYVFVDWSDGVTEETRTITAGVDMPETLTANFKVAVPRAWAYDLRLDADTDPANYIFTFTATSAGDATIFFTDEEGTSVAPTQEVVGTVAAGETKTIAVAKSKFTGDKDVYWSVKVEGDAIAKIAEVTDPTRNIYDFYNSMGVVVDNNTDSEYFGKIYIQQSYDGASDGIADRSDTQTAGIFIYDQGLNELNEPNTGIKPQLPYTIGGNRQNFKRIAINPTNGHIAFCNNTTDNGGAYSVSRENLTGEAVNLTKHIAEIKKVNALCFDDEGNLYVVANVTTQNTPNGSIYQIKKDGTYIKLSLSGENLFVNEDIAMATDGRGGLWIAQNRWGIVVGALFHVNVEEDKIDFKVEADKDYSDWFAGANYRGAIAYDKQRDILAVHSEKCASVFQVTYSSGVPSISKICQTPAIGGTAIDGLAFDYAGDLYLVSSGTERFYKYVLPTNNNTCTVPAPESQIIMKEARYTVTVEANDNALGTVSGGGEYKAGETITLTATPKDGSYFVNWTVNDIEQSTNDTYSFTVTEAVIVVANFEEILNNTIEPRAWAYNLKLGEEGDNYTFTFTATATADATLHFEYTDGTPAFDHTVGQVTAGPVAPITIAKSQFAGTKDIRWSVELEGAKITDLAKLTDDSKHDGFWFAYGVGVNNCPESPYFGNIYVSNPRHKNAPEQTGFYKYSPELVLDETIFVDGEKRGYKPSNVDIAALNAVDAIQRMAVSPVDGTVAFVQWNSAPFAAYGMNPANLAGDAVNLTEGINQPVALCYDHEGSLCVLSYDGKSGGVSVYGIHIIKNGEKTTFFSQAGWVAGGYCEIASDGQGGFYVMSGNLNASNVVTSAKLQHISKKGVIDLTVLPGGVELEASPSNFDRLRLAYDLRHNVFAIGGDKKVNLYKATYDTETGVPTLTKWISTPEIGNTVDGVAFDYAGDLYAVSAHTETFYKFVLPTEKNICVVPAADIIEVDKPKYTRDVTNGYFGTICLPYGSNNYSGAEFYEIAYLELQADGVAPKGIWLDEVTGALEAGKPYIFKATSNLLTVNYKGEEALSPVDGKAGLTGTFDDITDENVLKGNYMIYENQFWLCGTGCYLNANRAYIEHDALHATTTTVSPIPGRRRVMMGAAGENTTTGVDNLTEDGVVSTNQATKMVVNGQLIIIRDGVKYNAQGVRL